MKLTDTLRSPFRAGTAISALLLVAGVFSLGFAAPASAAPTSEWPASWTVTGSTATGTTPSGIVVTAELTGPAAWPSPASSSIIFTGAHPAYIPTGDVGLRYAIVDCSDTAVDGCGSLTYTFSAPVSDPIVYVGDFGAGTADQYHNAPLTSQDGEFSLLSPGSQSPRMAITNGGSTIEIPDTSGATIVGGGESCDDFGCGAYALNTSSSTVTSLTFDLSYAGTGTTNDHVGIMLAVTPPPPATPKPPAKPKVPADPSVPAGGEGIDQSGLGLGILPVGGLLVALAGIGGYAVRRTAH